MFEAISAKVLEHFRNPRNVGVLEDANGHGRVENPVCGDITDMYLKIVDGRIVDVKFTSLGCFATIASASALTEVVKGKTLKELLNFEEGAEALIERFMEMIRHELGNLPKAKWHCPPASIESFLRALIEYFKNIGGEEDVVRNLEEAIKVLKPYYGMGSK
ncbi:MAG: iron-sulfur cluster assembly scaffold protein [Candidatus Bathyarchaeia archaeon]|nr:iron-sulfur cluster assembly scaffold protein [Candidatus Bathyarchaeota archaeon]